MIMTGLVANSTVHKVKARKQEDFVDKSESEITPAFSCVADQTLVDISALGQDDRSLSDNIDNCVNMNNHSNSSSSVNINGANSSLNNGVVNSNAINNGASCAREVNGQKSTGLRRSRSDLRYVDVIRERPIRVTAKVLVPVREHPKFNFVGKLLGPKGNSMKRLQEETLTKMAVLGRGSMRDKQKEEELRASGDPKYLHLLEDLHVEITAFAPPAEAHARIAYSLAEIRRYLVPDNNDDIRKQQIREMEFIGDRKDGLKVVDGGGETLNGHGGPGLGRMDGEDRSGRPASPTDLRRSDPGSPCSASRLASPMTGNILSSLHHHPLPPPLPLTHPHHRSHSSHSPIGPVHSPLGQSPLNHHPHDLPPPRLLPWGYGSSRRRVLTILDKARTALDHTYEQESYSDYYYEEYDDYGGMEDYRDIYSPDCYDSGGGWPRYKPLLTPGRDRPGRCRSSPYSRPK
ncbi:KH domain-containing, RNA-binding, signal transduction-associated protein 3 [Hyalella azteca]|uniref:KH domain-containing, RNA-binding, signal transduction-associated protein 3 n=1 Tax=Hyalella azteca TaxID=294128 RepID=A0A8B7PLK7_HYAAZ|nr:KH domain-containing, RNA-binding, signal transduction-associated protein 3 [Hyalella azteca]